MAGIPPTQTDVLCSHVLVGAGTPGMLLKQEVRAVDAATQLPLTPRFLARPQESSKQLWATRKLHYRPVVASFDEMFYCQTY